EKYLVKNAKKMVLLGAGLAAQKYMQKIEDEQEILVNLADMAADVYNMESVILRTEKAINNTGADKNKQKMLYTEVYVQEAFERIESNAKETLITVEQGDTLRMMLSALRKLSRFTPKNVVHKKREIAAKIKEEEKYVVKCKKGAPIKRVLLFYDTGYKMKFLPFSYTIIGINNTGRDRYGFNILLVSEMRYMSKGKKVA